MLLVLRSAACAVGFALKVLTEKKKYDTVLFQGFFGVKSKKGGHQYA
jgi:hypothetical protein